MITSLFTPFFSSSLRAVVDMIGAMGRGDFSRTLASLPSALKPLEASINQLAASLNRQRSDWVKGKDQLQTVLDAMAEGVLVTNHGTEIVLMNPSMKKIFGLTGEEKGRTVLEAVRHHLMSDVILRVIQMDAPEQIEIKVTAGDEPKILMMHVVPFGQGDERGSVSVFYDVTHLRQLEGLRSDFVTNISHELKTPLTSIRGYAETLKEGAVNDPQAAARFLGKIERNAIYLQSLVEDILRLSEIESGKMEWHRQSIEIHPVFDSLIKDFQTMAEQKNIVLAEVGDSIRFPAFPCDAQALDRILSNLVSNAIRYTPQGGEVTLKAALDGNFIEISVADTGIGIPEKDLPRVFERFYRVDKARSRELGGTGLGLAIVKHLVQAQGGSMGVESEVGKGSRFFFRMPLA